MERTLEASFVLMRQLWVAHEWLLDGGYSPERPKHDYKLRTFSFTLHSLEKEQELGMELVMDHAYVMKPR